MRNIVSIIVSFILTFNLYPQQQSNWQNFADMKSTKDIISTNKGIWAASNGGAYFYDILTNSFKIL